MFSNPFNSLLEYANLITAFATVAYIWYTAKIIAESRIDRKIAYIDKQLEKLYYPTLHFLESYDEHKKGNGPGSPLIRTLLYRGAREMTSEIRKPACNELLDHRYLLIHNRDSHEIFKKFFDKKQSLMQIEGDRINIFDDLKFAIEEDIKFLEHELIGLLENK